MCWLVWPGLNAAINSCRSGSQWEYGPWRNSVAVCGHFFWPIFLFEKYGWLSRVLFLNWIKDSSRKMSTSTVWCKILLLDVLQICIFSFFFRNFWQACGWVGTETVHPNGKLQIPSICRLYAHQEENLNQNLLKMFAVFLTTYAVSTVVYTMQVPSRNSLFIHTKQFAVDFSGASPDMSTLS